MINAFDLDEISFLTGLNFNIVSDTGAKLIRMNLANKIMWEDDQNNEKRYLWYLSENGEKYLERNSYKSTCLLYTSPSPRDIPLSRMPSSA